MSEFEDIQRIIRLKRHEQPPQDFVEDFVGKFQQRQRAELLHQSARGLLWERVNTYFEGVFAPKWGWATATVMGMAAVFFAFKSPATQTGADGFQVTKVHMTEGVVNPTQEEVESYLTMERNRMSETHRMSRHYQGGLADEQRTQEPFSMLGPVPAQDGLLPAGFQYDIELK